MDIFNTKSFFCPTQVFMGINSHQKLREIFKDEKTNDLFFLCDKNIVNTFIYNSIVSILNECGIEFDIFTDILPEPSDKTVESAFQIYSNKKSPLILALGGGSTIDVGKGVGILSTNGGNICQYEGINKFKKPKTPLIAIPTTAGTGAEVSGSCALTDTIRGIKISIKNAALNPANYAILDPLALITLPAIVARDAGIDAFVHAFESYISLKSNLMTDGMNLQSIELISKNIRPFVSNRENLDAGLAMLCASSLAALGFSNTGAGNVHCVSRFVGSFCHISHGLANAVCFPHVAEFNLMANPSKYARLAEAMEVNVNGLSNLEAGRKVVEEIKQLNKDLGIPERLRDVGISKDMIPELARLSFEIDYNRWNPRYTSQDDFVKYFKDAY